MIQILRENFFSVLLSNTLLNFHVFFFFRMLLSFVVLLAGTWCSFAAADSDPGVDPAVHLAAASPYAPVAAAHVPYCANGG